MSKHNFKIVTAVTAALLVTGCAQGAQSSQEAAVQKEETKEDYQIQIPTEGTLSEAEQKADARLTEMKQEADALYKDPTPYAILDWNGTSPVHEELYQFCKALPKGGDLHVHDYTAIPVSDYIQILKDHGKVYIQLEEGPQYGFMYVSDIPENAVLLNEALENGSLTEAELKEILVMSEEDNAIGRWVSFENLFSTVMGFSADSALMQKVYEAGFRRCCGNHVNLVELRMFLSSGDDDINAGNLEMIRSAYYTVKAEYPEFTVRIIAVSGKNGLFEKETAINALRSAIRLSSTIKDEYDPENPQNFIIGLDLVNEEDASKPLSEYLDFFTSDEVKQSGLKLFLHAGESLRLDNDCVIDAYLAGAQRVGHAFNLYRYPELMEKYKENNIALEICPISNYRLGYVNDLRLHPGLTYMQNDIPVVICSDDGTFLTEAPLTDDYYSVILSWNLGIAEIRELCQNAIVYSGLSETEISSLMETWEADWDAFINTYAK